MAGISGWLGTSEQGSATKGRNDSIGHNHIATPSGLFAMSRKLVIYTILRMNIFAREHGRMNHVLWNNPIKSLKTSAPAHRLLQ